MRLTYKASLSAASLMALSMAMALPASAQLDEIIVTAQKREQSLQDVPIAVTAVNADYIDSRNITDIKSLSSLAPNLKIENTPGNTTAAQISIRGGVTINPALTWEPTVGIYLNGSYIGKTQGSVFDVADIERLEVLRGPQGTLYGRNTLAGAVNVITAKPTGEFGGKAKIGVGNYNSFLAKGSVNLGQLGPVRAKISAAMEKRDGFVQTVANPFPGVFAAGSLSTDELQSLNKHSFLVALSADLTENLALDYTFDYSDADQDPTFSQIVSVSLGNIFDPSAPPYVGFPGGGGTYFGFPLDLYTNPDYQSTGTVDGDVFEKSRVQGHNLTATLQTNIGEVKSITSLRKMDWDDALDLDGSPLPLAHTQRLSDYDSFSQELQLTGDAKQINYVLGAYYFKDDGYTINPQTFFGGANVFDSQYGFETDSIALYGQLGFALTDNFTLTSGLRYTEEDKSIERSNILIGTPNIPLVPTGTTADDTFDNVSGLITADYRFNENVNLYAKYSKGFKSGGFNGEAGSVVETIRPYRSETVDSFEIGAKTRFADNRAQLNGAIFLNKHKDMQLSVFTATGAAASDTRNAGKAEVKGLELEGLFQVSDSFLARGSFGYMDVEYKKFIEFGVDVANNRAFPHAPKMTFSAGFDWDITKTDFGTISLSADANHSAKYFTYPYSLTTTDPQHAFNTQAPARTLVDGRLALKNISLGDTEAELALWGKNIFDKKYLSNFIDFGPGFGGLTNGYFGTPATYGVSFGVNF